MSYDCKICKHSNFGTKTHSVLPSYDVERDHGKYMLSSWETIFLTLAVLQFRLLALETYFYYTKIRRFEGLLSIRLQIANEKYKESMSNMKSMQMEGFENLEINLLYSSRAVEF